MKQGKCKFIVGLILGLVISSGGVYAATAIAGSSITYSNAKSGLTSTDVQGAIDELYNKVRIGNFVEAYTYNATNCVTGKEETCQKTTCYKNKTANSCPAGTIIRYKVNDTEIVNFHVISDNGSKITMQSQKNTIYSMQWNTEFDNTKGPIILLPELENATSSWSNVNDQKYTLETNTGCSAYNSCTTNTYNLASRTSKARLITLQEAASLGCTTSNQSCPIWMYNYLGNSTSYGGTVNDSESGPAYWSSSAVSTSSLSAWTIYGGGSVKGYGGDNPHNARAVIEVSK